MTMHGAVGQKRCVSGDCRSRIVRVRRLMAFIAIACTTFVTVPVCSAVLITSPDGIGSPVIIDFSGFGHIVTHGPLELGGSIGLSVTFTSTNNSILGSGTYGLNNNGNWTSGPDGNGYCALQGGSGAMTYTFNFGLTNAVGAFVNYAAPFYYGSPIVEVIGSDGVTVLESYDLSVAAPIWTPNGMNAGAFRGISRPNADIRAFRLRNAFIIADLLRFSTSALCGNGAVDSGEACDDGNNLDGDCCASSCQFEPLHSPCPSDGESCTIDVCDGAGACTHPAGHAGTICRDLSGDCDVVERCDGVEPACPDDVLSSGGTRCRGPADLCDAEELCDGTSSTCPPDRVLTAGVPCRPSAGVCDQAEQCDGLNAACPADLKSTATCRPTADLCDVAESCNGIDDQCPVDVYVPLGTSCRAAMGGCDVAEVCTGSSAACPADGMAPDEQPCDDDDVCTQIDTCQSGSCSGAAPLDCSDGDPCTTDSCDRVDGCVNDALPASGCLPSGKAVVLIKDSDDDARDKLVWKWIHGSDVTRTQLADPTNADGYGLCIYAGTVNTAVASAPLPPGAGWSATSTGYKFKSATPEGLNHVLLKSGTGGEAKAVIKRKGTLPDAILPLAYPVTVQLKKDGSPLCLESVFTEADERMNDGMQYKAKRGR